MTIPEDANLKVSWKPVEGDPSRVRVSLEGVFPTEVGSELMTVIQEWAEEDGQKLDNVVDGPWLTLVHDADKEKTDE